MSRLALLALAVWTLAGALWPAPARAQTAPEGMGAAAVLPPRAAAETALATAAEAPIEVADGLELELWAPPGLVANPLTLDLDRLGRAYVVASSRAGMLLDIRQHPDWVPEVHSLETTEALRAFFRRVMAPERSAENDWLPDYNEDGSRDYRDLTVVAERVFRVEDTDGDGVADRSRVVHEGFNDDIASDIAGGILIHGEDLFVTAAPDLWRLRDTTGDGLFDQKTSLSHGYSIHPAFSGHDMSALAIGPDGRLYWKIGDIGLNVVDDDGRRWAYPNQGAVLRAELDGSGFEVFATGLRNTQEIAFDAHGNLISVDNDGDHAGETERVVYLVQGADAGWRSTWQYGKYTDARNNDYNVWMDEQLFRPRFDGQAAYITPPVAPYHAGPSGFAYNPGTALDARWRGHFFVTSFTGGAGNARVFAFRLEEDGAGFTLAGDTEIVEGLLSSGIAFGPDGALYLTDWIRGWGATGEGLLWRLDAPGAAASPARREVAALLASDFRDKRRAELEALLAHADMRIRQLAQFALVGQSESGTLRAVAEAHENRLARIHALWGLGQLARADAGRAEAIRPLLADDDDEIRAQAAKMLGDARDAGATGALIAALADPAPRVRFFAAEALGRIGAPSAIVPIAGMLAANDGEDVYLRTAGVHALAGIGDPAALEALAAHRSAAVRIAAVVALRRLGDPRAAMFLEDADPLVVTEAARAINDEGGIVQALPALAAALDGPIETEAFVRRALSANLRVGDGAAARRVGAFAARDGEPEPMRREAVAVLGVWGEPSTLDRVDGAWIGQPGPRDTAAARIAATGLLELLETPVTSAELRIAILDTAVSLRLDRAADAMRIALADADPRVRMAAIEAVPAIAGAAGVVPQLTSIIDAGTASTGERQSALAALGSIGAPEAAAALGALLDRLAAGGIVPELELDLLLAASLSDSEAVLGRLDRFGAGRTLAALAETRPAALLAGGSAQRGRQLALRHPAAQCTRCHTLGNSRSEVGPALDGIGARLSRAELLESLIEPGATLAAGFGDVGEASAMPPMAAILSPREIRDLVEFLAAER